MNIRKWFLGGMGLVLGALPGLGGAAAISSDLGDQAGESSGPALTEVIVTARRREENVQTVPIAIDVLSQQRIQANNIHSIGDLQILVPSMTAPTGLDRDSVAVTIRGQGTNGVSTPGVVTYINEVPIPTDHEGGLAGGPGLLFDMENVQILKGPQGTLFGESAVGGALLLQTARPSPDFGGHIQLSYGNYRDKEVDGAVNLPITDTLLARFAINGQVRDGFTHLLGDPTHPNGIDADNRDYWSARGTVTFRPNEYFQNDTIVTFSDYNSHGAPVILTSILPTSLAGLVFPSYFTLLAQQQALGVRYILPVDTAITSSGSNLSVNNITRLTLNDKLTFRNILGYDDWYQSVALDIDATALPIANIPSTPRQQTVHQITEEAQLLGNTDRLKWIVGAFVLDQPLPNWVLETGKFFGGEADDLRRLASDSQAVFGQGTYDLSEWIPRVKVTGGVRYNWYDVINDNRGNHGPGAICTVPMTNCDIATNLETKGNAFTWTGGVDYQAAPDTLLYLTSRRGFRPGAGNPPPSPLPSFGPEFVNDVELGIKSDWKVGDVPVRTNLDLYYQDYKDIQVTQVVLTNGTPNTITANAATARQWGTEFEALLQLTRDLQVRATFDYLSFRYTEIQPGVNQMLLANTETAGRPPRKYGVDARYRLPLSKRIGDVTVSANWNYQAKSGSYYVADGGMINSFSLVNMNLDWENMFGSTLDASLFASNLLNRVYEVGGAGFFPSFGFAVETYGEPRMYGIRLRYRFGHG